jgi:glycosyltransferase involved in cell wall biosynthesis
MSTLPFVSICLLTYNRAQQLSRSLDSLLRQTHQNFELIINDDRSPDNTEQVCRIYAERDSRIKYYKNEKNLRYAGNQNAALARASSEFVAIVHDGDVYREDLIEHWVKALVAAPSAALVFNALNAMDHDGKIVKTFRQPYPALIPGLSLHLEMLQRVDSPIFGIVMVRKSCVQSVGQFNLNIPTLADVDMWLRLLEKYDAAYIDEPLLSISARELNHHNQVGNWKVKAQHELIYALALQRLSSRNHADFIQVQRNVRKMLLRERVRWLLSALKRLRIMTFIEGVRFCSRPVFAKE